MPETRYATCPLCEAICGIAVDVDGDRIVKIRGDEDDPFSRGYVCPKAVALMDVHHDPDRLRHPVRREGDRWIEVGWDEALGDIAARLARIQDRHGKDDALLLAALIRTIFDEDLTSVDRLAPHVDGLDALRDALRPFSPEAVAGPTGIAADVIRGLARDFARAHRRLLRPSPRRWRPPAPARSARSSRTRGNPSPPTPTP